MVERSLSMREVRGSMPLSSNYSFPRCYSTNPTVIRRNLLLFSVKVRYDRVHDIIAETDSPSFQCESALRPSP